MPVAVENTQPNSKVEKEVVLPPFEYAGLLTHTNHGDWRDDLARDGFVVIDNAVPTDRALEYRDKAFSWIESFGLGFDRNDKTTWVNEKMPVHIKGGMFHNYGFSHEQWVWDLRQEQGIIDAFAKVWGTDKLITSFDGGSVFLPGRTDVKDSGKWEHIDQSCHRRGFYCVQGLINLNDCGAQDGGLMVLKGSSVLMDKFFDHYGRTGIKSWGPFDWYGFTDEQQQWFFDNGCEWVKVEGRPGSLFLWNSQTMHYNVRPSGDRDRVCTYICMAPAHLLSEDDKATRKLAFEENRSTTHVPFAAIYSRAHEPVKRGDGNPDPLDTGKPKDPKVVTEKMLQLAGISPYA